MEITENTQIVTPEGTFNLPRAGTSKVQELLNCPAAKTGVVTSGTTNRLLTLGSGHGLDTGDTGNVAVFWAGGCRRDLEVTANDDTTITVTAESGAGDSFPVNGTEITVAVVVVNDAVSFSNDGLQRLFIGAEAKQETFSIHVDLTDGADSVLAASVVGGECYQWIDSSGPDNPVSETIVAARGYSGSITATTIKIAALIA
jgi:hypothetical protein